MGKPTYTQHNGHESLRCSISDEVIKRGEWYFRCEKSNWCARLNHYSRYHPDVIDQTSQFVPCGNSRDTKLENIENFDGGGWILVRQLVQGKKWHSSNDNLAGKEEYVEDKGRSFSHIFCQEEFDQFLFVSGDRYKWLMADRHQVNGEEYHGKSRKILMSCISNKPTQALWYNRNRAEDPWISVVNHQSADADDYILYGEGSNNGHNSCPDQHGGCQVFIRNSDKKNSVSKKKIYGENNFIRKILYLDTY